MLICLRDWVSVLDDGDENSDVSLGDRAKLETMCLSHPIDFATAGRCKHYLL